MNVQKIFETRQILEKKDRNSQDIDKLVQLIKDYGFLKNRGDLSQSDYRDIAMNLQFKEVNEFQNAIDFGAQPETFLMLLNGIVSIKIKNQEIKKWDFAWKEYQKLLKWKNE